MEKRIFAISEARCKMRKRELKDRHQYSDEEPKIEHATNRISSGERTRALTEQLSADNCLENSPL